MVLVMSALSFLTLPTRLRPRGRGYGVLWLVRAETGSSSETALLLLTLRWNEKSRGLGGDGGENTDSSPHSTRPITHTSRQPPFRR